MRVAIDVHIKEENKPGAKGPEGDGLPSRAMSVPALDPGRGLFRAKSPPSVSSNESVARIRSPSPPKVRMPVKMPERFKSPEPPSKMAEQIVRSPHPPQAALSPEPVTNGEQAQNGLLDKSLANGNAKLPSTNQMDTTDDQGLTRKKVVKVVRRVVRKVLPTELDEVTAQTQPSDKAPEAVKPAAEPAKAASAAAAASKAPSMVGFSFKHDVIKTEDKDDISRGLTNFMTRGRTREPRPRIRKEERPEKMELEKTTERKEEKVESEEQKEDKTTPRPQEVNHNATSSGPATQEVKSPVAALKPSSMAAQQSAAGSSLSTHSKPSSVPTVAGFIPAPKHSPLSPPPGFIPAPRPAATKPSPVRPPSTTPGAQKSSSLSPPSRLVPAPKPSPPIPNHPCPGPGAICIQQPAEVHVCSPFGTLVWTVHGHLKCMFEMKESLTPHMSV
ncbi:neurofilament heavy polypeptide-like [Pempheris klunzingeri]|uniref:neurofilament heavy polypeptide-like n=1 Tax=Pempheris klunzingeri TaxID=3127111 RepID=UPI00397FC6AB